MSSPSLSSTTPETPSLIPSSSSSSPDSSSSEYVPEPGYSYVFSPYLQHKSSRIIPGTGPQQNKRKRDSLDTGLPQHTLGYPPAAKMNEFREPLIISTPASSLGPTGKLKAKPPKSYKTSEEMLAALAATCLEDQVDFSGSYVCSDVDAISDKQRVQKVANAIWKATGYRFTVKDHPPTDRGHKTRLWCSQDEARRSKHRGNSDAPRISKQGELFAKPRYPCRSRLMIACVPEGGRGTRLVTVRMHHNMRHETYFEAEGTTVVASPSAPPPVAPPLLTTASQFLSMPLPPHLMHAQPASVAPPPSHPQFTQEPEPEPSATPSPRPTFAAAQSPVPPPQLVRHPQFPPAPPPPTNIVEQQHALHPHHPTPPNTHQPYSLAPAHSHLQSSPLIPHTSIPTQPALLQGVHSQMTPAEFEHRMRTHITRIRDFCDGLEYQLQFRDVKMLEVLERDAAPFLQLRDACLAGEGR
ncbi:hypothetical protein FB45DRAFT_889001 [Roridomyces roridus]|uniref:Uncharacterized protein n=1 Tax=Roridomyces roridus TaxID=1738132 RepID=A0AAD7CK45_9AGAR|nr:hypothetical protein FB45DRAFT_889001 [Roridomyces roridus]